MDVMAIGTPTDPSDPANFHTFIDLPYLQSLRFQPKDRPDHPKELVLHCARHECGTRGLRRTWNLAAVMKTMGHRDVKTARHDQHPQLETVRPALDYGAASETA